MSNATEYPLNSSSFNISNATDPASSSSFPYFDSFLRPLVPYNCAISIPAILLNCLVFRHYTRDYKKYVPSMYLIITSCDTLMSLSMLFYHIILELSCDQSAESVQTSSVFILLFVAVQGVSYRCSVFANVLLAVSRTIQINSPLYRIRMLIVPH